MSTTNGDTPVTNGEFLRLARYVSNALTLRRDAWMPPGGDHRRDIDDECGYNRTPSLHHYQALYDREPIADKVISFWPKETWQVSPLVYEEEDSDTITPFEIAWDAVGRELAGEDGLFQSELGSPIWEYLKRVDILSGIGHYGVLLLGLDDGLPLDQPARGLREQNTYPVGKDKSGQRAGVAYEPGMNRRYNFTVNVKETTGRKLLYLRAFSQNQAEIVAYETNFTSPRFGQPTMYRISFGDPSTAWTAFDAATTTPTATRDVHWSRVIHVADTHHQPGGSEILAVPRLLPVIDPITDIRKVRASSAEMYYKGAFPGYSFETDPGLGGDVDVNATTTRDTIEQWMNGLQRVLMLNGLVAKSLAPQVVDPTAQIDAQEQSVCTKMDVPWRIWRGSERGELASSQDQNRHQKNVAGRQNCYATPRMIQPLVGRLVTTGVLPRPKQIICDWPAIDTLSGMDKAQVCLVKTQALAAYVSGGVENLIPPLDYLTRYMGETEEEATATLESAEEHQGEVQERDLARKEEEIDRGLMADPTQPKPGAVFPGEGAP